MNNFLREIKKLRFVTDNLCIVLGNESCDLDSAISSLCLAFFYNKNHDKIPLPPPSPLTPSPSSTITSTSSSSSLSTTEINHPDPIKMNITRKSLNVIPLFNINRKEFPLKTEVKYFLNLHSIDTDLLLFKDDINDDILQRNYLILVDHHQTTKYSNSVIAIYDHRPYDEKSFMAMNNLLFKNIKLVGSCSTLIADQILDLHNSKDYLECLKLLYGAIVLDTVCFSKTADKATTLDSVVAFEIENLMELDDPSEYREQLYKDLIRAKSDISELTSCDLLYKDLKILTKYLNLNNYNVKNSNSNNNDNAAVDCSSEMVVVENNVNNKENVIKIAFSGFPMLVKDYIKINDVEKNVKKFYEIENCSILILIGMKYDYDNGTVTRDLGIINMRTSIHLIADLYDKIVDILKFSNEPNFNLEEYLDFDEPLLDGKFFKQNNIKVTRKQMIPLVESVLDKL